MGERRMILAERESENHEEYFAIQLISIIKTSKFN